MVYLGISTKDHDLSHRKPLWYRLITTPRNRSMRRKLLLLLALSALTFFISLTFRSVSVHKEKPFQCPTHPTGWTSSTTSTVNLNGTGSTPPAGSPKTVAVFIEARPLPNIPAIITYFAGYLGPSWPIHIYHSPDNAVMLATSSPIAGLVARGQVVLHLLPPDSRFDCHDDVSEFLTSEWIWESLSLLSATHALLFQADSILCSSSPLRPEHFLDYAFIGAPIAPQFGIGSNGGLSIRHIPTMLRTVRTFDWSDDDLNERQPEDQWFAAKIPKLANPPAPPLPTRDQSRCFSVETMWAENPMGYHQPKRWNLDRLPEILAWCPEIVLAENDGVFWKAGRPKVSPHGKKSKIRIPEEKTEKEKDENENKNKNKF